MKLLVLACLVAVCYGRFAPAAIPETFTSTLSITRSRGEHSEMGRGVWERNAELMDFMYKDVFTNSQTKREEEFEMLGLYDKHMRYSIMSGPNSTLHCREEKIPDDDEFPKVWEWLSDPKTTKEEKTINGTSITVYTTHERDETIELWVTVADPTKPYAEIRDGRDGKEMTRYLTFEPMAPPSTDFEVPKECEHPPPPRRGHV